MKKIILVVAALCTLGMPASAQVREWKAIAVLPHMQNIQYWGAIRTGSSEEAARRSAITACESVTGRTCKSALTSSVPMSWYLVASLCNDAGAAGGSQYDAYAANTRAGMRLGYKDGASCTPLWTFPPDCADTAECAIRQDQ